MTRAALLLVAAFSVISVGCAHKMAAPPPPPPPETILESTNNQDSLFKGDQAVLSDQDISRILSTHIDLADRHRVAILNVAGRNWWSDELAGLEAKNADDLVRALKASPQLSYVSFLPALLVPEKRTVPYLREAAARVQADLLFVYNTRIETFQRDRFFKSPDEVHAQCIAESVLLDVRTGIVVQTGQATENIALKKTSADASFSETVARAESQARGKAVISLANQVVQHLAGEK